MVQILNRFVDEIEQRLAEKALDFDEFAGTLGKTGYHARRMFSALAGMPVSRTRAVAAHNRCCGWRDRG